MKKIAILLIFALTMAGCTPKQDSDLKKITFVLDWTPNTNHTGLYTAIEKGYFKDEGLDVEIVQPAENTAVDMVSGGAAQFGISFQEEVSFARTASTPMDVVAIAAVIQHNTSGFAAPRDKGINSPRDFEGKTYGGWGTPLEKPFLSYVMSQDGGDVENVNMLTDNSTDFLTGVSSNYDFAWIFEGWDGMAAKLAGMDVAYFSLVDYGIDFYTPVIISSQKYLSENEKIAKKFMRAVSKGYADCAKNPEECAQYLLKNSPELDRNLVLASQKFLADKYIDDAPRWGEMKKETWVNFTKFLNDNKMLENDLDIGSAFTNIYLP